MTFLAKSSKHFKILPSTNVVRAMVAALSLIVRVPISFIKHHDGKELGKGRNDFILHFGVHHPVKPGQEFKHSRNLEVETMENCLLIRLLGLEQPIYLNIQDQTCPGQSPSFQVSPSLRQIDNKTSTKINKITAAS